MQPSAAIIADASRSNWVDRFSPAPLKPYLKLARFDRPIGAWLLLFPCWWSQVLAEIATGMAAPSLWLLILFAIGAFVMRGAGCTWNDIVDRDYDARVERTALRPIPSGQVTVPQAIAFAIGLSLIGFVVLIQLNGPTIWLGISSLLLVALYPFAKRFTHWPQIVLGLVFKWGALVGWSAVTGSVGAPALALYAGCVLWTIGYDTVYAHQDKQDDERVGLKSTALRLGDQTQAWLAGFYGGAIALWAVALVLAGGNLASFAALVMVAAHFAWQVATLDTADSANCLQRFRSNRHVGWLFLTGLVADMTLIGQL